MAQFTHKQAENFRLDVVAHFPHLDVENKVLDVEIDGKYQYSFFAIWSDGKKFTSNFSSEESWNNFLSICQYIARTIADNQQSEEYDHSASEQAMVKYADWKKLSQQERFEQHGNVEI